MHPYDKVEWVFVRSTITSINMDKFYFLSCPLPFDGMQCMKKVVHNSAGMWHCTKCNGDFTECDYRYVLKFTIHDHTGELENVTAFDDVAFELLSVAAKDLYLMSREPDTIREIGAKVSFRHFLFTLSYKTETFNDTQRLKVVLIKSEQLSYASTSNLILDDMKAFTGTQKRVIRQLLTLFFHFVLFLKMHTIYTKTPFIFPY